VSKGQVNIGTLYAQRGIFLAGKQPAPLPDHVEHAHQFAHGDGQNRSRVLSRLV
jgi:hypothetical protein